MILLYGCLYMNHNWSIITQRKRKIKDLQWFLHRDVFCIITATVPGVCIFHCPWMSTIIHLFWNNLNILECCMRNWLQLVFWNIKIFLFLVYYRNVFLPLPWPWGPDAGVILLGKCPHYSAAIQNSTGKNLNFLTKTDWLTQNITVDRN